MGKYILLYVDKQINKKRFVNCRLFMKKVELQALVKRFDTRGDGKSINVCEYMAALREPL